MYFLDTSVYGVLPDREDKDYETVQGIIEYAKEHRESFVTTNIVSKELSAEGLAKEHKDIILPEYYLSVSQDKAALEVVLADKYREVRKLAWSYIQKLGKKDTLQGHG